jgi:hypothetical protein
LMGRDLDLYAAPFGLSSSISEQCRLMALI